MQAGSERISAYKSGHFNSLGPSRCPHKLAMLVGMEAEPISDYKSGRLNALSPSGSPLRLTMLVGMETMNADGSRMETSSGHFR